VVSLHGSQLKLFWQPAASLANKFPFSSTGNVPGLLPKFSAEFHSGQYSDRPLFCYVNDMPEAVTFLICMYARDTEIFRGVEEDRGATKGLGANTQMDKQIA